MICHGSSSPRAIMNAIRMAHDSEARQVTGQLIRSITEDFNPAPLPETEAASRLPLEGDSL